MVTEKCRRRSSVLSESEVSLVAFFRPSVLIYAINYRRAALEWREQQTAREAIAAALQDVRQRRAARTMDPLTR